MSFYAPEQRCPRCQVPLARGVTRCSNCGLVFATMGGVPLANRSGQPPSWQPNDAEGYGSPSGADRFGDQGGSGRGMNRPEQPLSGGSGPTPFQRPAPDSPQRSGAFRGFSGSGDRSRDYQRPPFGQGSNPFDSRRGPADSRAGSPFQQDATIEASETAAGFSQPAAPPYGQSQPFLGGSGQPWQQGGRTWPQPSAGAGTPTVYGGTQPAYGGSFAPDASMGPPMQPPRRGRSVLLITLVVVVMLVAVGGGAAYLFLRPKPIITVTSKYAVGSTPAGAATTTLSLTGSQFASNSAVSFLLDGQAEPGHQTLQSDANGAISGTLTVTTGWAVGPHTLTAKDANGDVTAVGEAIVVVAQGAANTPGPNGSPADTASFTINLTVHAHDTNTGQDNTYDDTLTITGQPDPAGGTVCNPAQDTGQPQSDKGTTNGLRFTETFTITCSGTYENGKLTYTQTATAYKIVFSNGVTCQASAAFVNQELDGTFTSATEISGTLTSGTPNFTCSNHRSLTLDTINGTWDGSMNA